MIRRKIILIPRTDIVKTMQTNYVSPLHACGSPTGAEFSNGGARLLGCVMSRRIEGINVNWLVNVASRFVKIPRSYIFCWNIDMLFREEYHCGRSGNAGRREFKDFATLQGGLHCFCFPNHKHACALFCSQMNMRMSLPQIPRSAILAI